MLIFNRSEKTDAEVKDLLEFAARGIEDKEVLVEVNTTKQLYPYGTAYNIGHGRPDLWPSCVSKRWVERYWKGGRHSQYRFLIVLYLPRYHARHYGPGRLWRFRQKWMQRKYPDGIPIMEWEDEFIMLAAHEFRHIFQFQRNDRRKKKGKKIIRPSEVDANKYGIKRLNDWRDLTDRPPLEAIKLDNPFTKEELQTA